MIICPPKIYTYLSILFFVVLSASIALAQNKPPVVIQEEPNGDTAEEEFLTWKDRIRVGGSIGALQFGNPTSISVSPMVGYMINSNTLLGGSLSYNYQKSTYYGSYSLLGTSVFAQHFPAFLQEKLPGIYLQGEYQKFNYLSSNPYNYTFDGSYMLGGGYRQGGKHFGFSVSALYILNYNQGTSYYGSPLVLRVNFF